MVNISLLSAFSVAMTCVKVTPPFYPSFVKLDISDIPALIAAFACGPVSGVIIVFIKNIVGLSTTATGGIGELANFLIGASMILPAGIIYLYNKTKIGAIISLSAGTIIMTVTAAFLNYFILMPLYCNFIPMNVLIKSYSSIHFIKTQFDIIIYATIPFNIIKGLLISLITFPVYKKLSIFLKGTKMRSKKYDRI